MSFRLSFECHRVRDDRRSAHFPSRSLPSTPGDVSLYPLNRHQITQVTCGVFCTSLPTSQAGETFKLPRRLLNVRGHRAFGRTCRARHLLLMLITKSRCCVATLRRRLVGGANTDDAWKGMSRTVRPAMMRALRRCARAGAGLAVDVEFCSSQWRLLLIVPDFANP